MSTVSTLTIFDAAVPYERAGWLAAWETWPTREPFAHPAYVEAFLGKGERAVFAMGRDVLLPMIVRTVPGGGHDLVTPYGYGGPYGGGEGAFWTGIEAWAREIGAATLFARLPLFDAARFPGEVAAIMDNVVVDLTGTPESRWQSFEHKVRKNVKRAKSEGLRVEVDLQGEHLDDFLRIYAGTMERRDAAEGYRFSVAFFQKLLREMPGCVAFLHVLAGDTVVSTEMVLVGAENVYSFLGGTDEAWFAARPNDLLKYEIIEWASALGKRRFVLGGGYGLDDGIFRYKKAFAPEGVVPFCVGRLTFDSDRVVQLVEARQAREPGWTPQPGFFPAYRAPHSAAG